MVAVAQKKIRAINEDIAHSKGLSPVEVEVAAKVGLIDAEQKYWWREEWQKGEREAETRRTRRKDIGAI